MANLQNEIRLANLLLSLGKAELSLEQARQKLSQHRMFDPLLLFKLLDPKDAGIITYANLRKYLSYENLG